MFHNVIRSLFLFNISSKSTSILIFLSFIFFLSFLAIILEIMILRMMFDIFRRSESSWFLSLIKSSTLTMLRSLLCFSFSRWMFSCSMPSLCNESSCCFNEFSNCGLVAFKFFISDLILPFSLVILSNSDLT